MAITAASVMRYGQMTEVRVTSDLSADPVYYHWFNHGAYLGRTTTPMVTVSPQAGEQLRVAVIDTTDPDYDPIANAPDGYPARRTIKWHTSQASDVSHYHVEENEDAGGWTKIGTVAHDGKTWQYTFTTLPLTDLASYQFRVKAVDTAGNEGTALTLAAATVVRTPDAPAFALSFDEGTTKVTISAA